MLFGWVVFMTSLIDTYNLVLLSVLGQQDWKGHQGQGTQSGSTSMHFFLSWTTCVCVRVMYVSVLLVHSIYLFTIASDCCHEKTFPVWQVVLENNVLESPGCLHLVYPSLPTEAALPTRSLLCGCTWQLDGLCSWWANIKPWLQGQQTSRDCFRWTWTWWGSIRVGRFLPHGGK